jgi:hypothetical protein
VAQQPYPTPTEGRWVPFGRRTNAAGYAIPGGLIYIGRHLRVSTGQIEPALINPDLPVAPAQHPLVGADLDPPPAYHLISPAARAAYLGWQAGGRCADVPAGLVLLFCLGLERRVLCDAGDDRAVRHELPAILAEVRRLRVRYGDGDRTLQSTLDRLLDLLELLAAPRGAPSDGPDPAPAPASPARSDPSAAAPMAVRVALARFAATATPLPAQWARAWARHHPLLTPRSAQTRCPEEFDRLFTLRYLDRHGPGLVPPDDGPGIRLRYQPANPGLTTTLVCREDLPDVLAEPRSGRVLGRLTDGVAAILDPYSRWLARYPEGRGSLAATTLLPAELLDPGRGRLGALRVWAEARLDGRPLAVVDGAEFAAFWTTVTPLRMARDEAAAFIAVLALLGVGVEPDVRFGAPALGAGPAVLFRLGQSAAARPQTRARTAADRPRAEFAAAAAIARCAAAVAAAVGPVEPHGPVWAGVLATVSELAAPFRLTPAERSRLTARLGWLLATGVNVDRLGRQTALLSTAEREITGDYLISVAAAVTPAVGPATVTALTRAYRILGLDSDLLFHRLHASSVAPPLGPSAPSRPPPTIAPGQLTGTDEPVVVRPADPVTGGYALPWAAVPAPSVAPAAPPPVDQSAAPGEVRLDPMAITRKIAESAAAATLLAAIFDAEESPHPESPSSGAPHPGPPRHEGALTAGAPGAGVPGAESAPSDDDAESIAGLDPAHSSLLRALAARRSWTPQEFAALAEAYRVLPDGALDLLNEAAIDTAGGPVIEGGATLVVDDDILQELFG